MPETLPQIGSKIGGPTIVQNFDVVAVEDGDDEAGEVSE
jgi:hypothetical protein